MDKKLLITKIKKCTSAIDMLNMKEDILKGLGEKKKKEVKKVGEE